MADTLPKSYGDEMKGISQAANLSLGTLKQSMLVMKHIYESNCVSIYCRGSGIVQYFLRSFIIMYIDRWTRSKR